MNQMSEQYEWDNMSSEQRLNLFKKSFSESNKIWLLVDEYGSVMMTTDDEDCIPVWPNEEAALQWATDDWLGFTSKAISKSDWVNKWTSGLEQDDLSIVVFPVEKDDGLVMYPDEFEQQIIRG